MAIFSRNHLFALVAAAAISGCTTVPDEPQSIGTDAPATENTENTDNTATSYGTGDGSVTGGSVSPADYGSTTVADAALSITTVYFDFDKANIRPDAYVTLKAHAVYLSANAAARLRLNGHADERGTREYNLALGERRGKAAANYLAANGVSRSQIEVVSYGEERPAVTGNNESALAKNRRVELKYTNDAP